MPGELQREQINHDAMVKLMVGRDPRHQPQEPA